MPRILVIGYGNPLRGDDGIGRRAAEQVQEVVGESAEIEILSVHQLTPDLAKDISEAQTVVFIDARADGQPGSISCAPVRDAPMPLNASTHSLCPAHLLSSTRMLYRARPEAWLLTATGECFEHGEELTPRARSAATMLAQIALNLIGTHPAADN